MLAFDASTLELHLRFGGDKIKREAYGMAVVSEVRSCTSATAMRGPCMSSRLQASTCASS